MYADGTAGLLTKTSQKTNGKTVKQKKPARSLHALAFSVRFKELESQASQIRYVTAGYSASMALQLQQFRKQIVLEEFSDFLFRTGERKNIWYGNILTLILFRNCCIYMYSNNPVLLMLVLSTIPHTV